MLHSISQQSESFKANRTCVAEPKIDNSQLICVIAIMYAFALIMQREYDDSAVKTEESLHMA